MPSERSKQFGAQGGREVEGGFLLDVVGGRDAHVEQQTFVSYAAIARLRREASGAMRQIIRDGGRSGILVTFRSDSDNEPTMEPRRGLVQEVLIPDELELPAPPSKPQPAATPREATE